MEPAQGVDLLQVDERHHDGLAEPVLDRPNRWCVTTPS